MLFYAVTLNLKSRLFLKSWVGVGNPFEKGVIDWKRAQSLGKGRNPSEKGVIHQTIA